MFASLISRLPAPLRRALAYAKAFAFLEEPPTALPRGAMRSVPAAARTAAAWTPTDPAAACPTDRRRRAPGVRHGATLTAQLRSCGAGPGRRAGAVPRPKQLCRTPTHGRPATMPATPTEDRRRAVAGGFLHRS